MDFTKYSFNCDDKRDYYFGLFSDLHLDSEKFERDTFIKDANKAIDRGARLLFNGDIFDAILPTDRKRYTRGNDGFNEDAQINERIEYAFRLFEPYADYIDFMGIGNHEASIVKYDHVDLVKMLVRELSLIRSKELPPIQRGSYQGFLRFTFTARDGKDVRSFDIYRDHGKGGASPVTKGIIGLNRIHTTFVADLYWLGHTHTNVVDNTPWTVYPNSSGRIIKKKKRSIITAGYHDSFVQRDLTDGNCYRSSFDEEKFWSPSGIGSALIHVSIPKDNTTDIDIEVIS